MKKLLCILALFGTTSAFAGLLVEPQLGYVVSSSYSGSATIGSSSINVNEKTSGMTLGGRLGYQMLGLMGGLNFSHLSGTSTDKTKTPTVDTDVTGNDMGIFIGYNAPILIRAWVAYNFSSKVTFNQTNASSTNGDYHKGTSTEIGAGFTGLPFLSVNLIYRMYNYTKTYAASNSTTYTASGLKPNSIELAISAPFNLL